jgi:hypothetical protein
MQAQGKRDEHRRLACSKRLPGGKYDCKEKQNDSYTLKLTAMNEQQKNKNQDQHKNQPKSGLTDTSKGKKTDTSNSLNRDAVGDKGVNNYTPQNRTDNEQGTEKE